MFAEGAGAECPAEGLRMSLQKNVSNAAGGTPAEGDQNNPMKLSSMAGNNNGGRPLRKVNKYCSLACGRYEEHEEHARAKSTKTNKKQPTAIPNRIEAKRWLLVVDLGNHGLTTAPGMGASSLQNFCLSQPLLERYARNPQPISDKPSIADHTTKSNQPLK